MAEWKEEEEQEERDHNAKTIVKSLRLKLQTSGAGRKSRDTVREIRAIGNCR